MPKTNVHKTPANAEPTEVKVAKISFKQAIIAALITTVLGTVGTIIVTLINKPPVNENSASNSNGEIQYIEQSTNTVIDELKKRETELSNSQEEIEQKIVKTQDPKYREELGNARTVIRKALTINRATQGKIREMENEIKTARRKGEGVKALMLHKQENDALNEEADARIEAQKVIVKANLFAKVDITRGMLLREKNYIFPLAADSLVTPEYPPAAKKKNLCGLISLDIDIDNAGQVVKAESELKSPILKPLQKAAIQAALKSKFRFLNKSVYETPSEFYKSYIDYNFVCAKPTKMNPKE